MTKMTVQRPNITRIGQVDGVHGSRAVSLVDFAIILNSAVGAPAIQGCYNRTIEPETDLGLDYSDRSSIGRNNRKREVGFDAVEEGPIATRRNVDADAHNRAGESRC